MSRLVFAQDLNANEQTAPARSSQFIATRHTPDNCTIAICPNDTMRVSFECLVKLGIAHPNLADFTIHAVAGLAFASRKEQVDIKHHVRPANGYNFMLVAGLPIHEPLREEFKKMRVTCNDDTGLHDRLHAESARLHRWLHHKLGKSHCAGQTVEILRADPVASFQYCGAQLRTKAFHRSREQNCTPAPSDAKMI